MRFAEVAGDRQGAVENDRFAQSRGNKVASLAKQREGASMEDLANRREPEVFADKRDAAAEDDPTRSEKRNDVGEGLTHGSRGILEDLSTGGVASARPPRLRRR